jgi:hypothetical protein
MGHVKQLLSIVLLTTLVPAFSQNVSGIPESTLPVNGSYFSISTENDIFGSSFFNENDDLRTFSFNAELFPFKEYGLMITYDGLTNRGSNEEQGRIDALVVTLGHRIIDRRGETHSFSVMVGSGARVYGDLGGEAFQKSFHESRNIKRPIELPYDDFDSAGALAYLSGRWWIDSGLEPSRSVSFVPPGVFVLSLGNELMGTTLMEFQTTADLTLSLESQQSVIMTGLEYYFGTSDLDSTTVETVNEFESGFWFKYGFYIGNFFSTYGFHLSHGISQGSAGIARNSHSIARNILLTFDYRGGNGPYYQYPQNAVLMDQYTLGATINLFPIKKGLQLNPFLTALIGFRNELLCPQSNGRTHSIARALYPLVQGETGVRLTYGSYESNTLYGLGVAFEGFTQLPTVNSKPGKFYDAAIAHDISMSIRLTVIAIE